MPLHAIVERKMSLLVSRGFGSWILKKQGLCVIALRKDLFNKVQLSNIVMGCLVYRRLIARRKPGLPLDKTIEFSCFVGNGALAMSGEYCSLFFSHYLRCLYLWSVFFKFSFLGNEFTSSCTASDRGHASSLFEVFGVKLASLRMSRLV